ncbi:MFS transporter, partial [Corallococcus coralloides]|nr:MFS transporter [Corallococcus coralloides]
MTDSSSSAPHTSSAAAGDAAFSWRRIALPAFGPSLLFGVGEGAILPIVPLLARDLGASVPMAAFV